MSSYEVESTILKTKFGEFNFYCFSWGKHEEDNILVLHNEKYDSRPLIRIQSACYTAEIFRSLDCDCHAQLSLSQKLISIQGGILIYMLCDGRGAGLLNKIKGMDLTYTKGIDTSDAYKHLQLEQDPRNYDKVLTVLSYFKVKQASLLTNNPRKIKALEKGGLDVERFPLEIPSTIDSKSYLKTKALKMDHLLSEFK